MVDTSLQNCSLDVTSHYRQENVLFPHFSAKFCRNCTNCNCLARARWSELYDLTLWAAVKRTLSWHTLYDRSYLLEWAQYSADRHCICQFVHLVSRSHSSCTGFSSFYYFQLPSNITYTCSNRHLISVYTTLMTPLLTP